MRITIVKGADGERVSEFDEQAIVLGREGTMKLTDRTVSKRHARLRRNGSAWYVEDMGSRNGTFINNTRVVEPRPVNDGDRLKIGSTIMVVSELNGPGGERHVGPAPEASPRAAVPPAEQVEAAPLTPDLGEFETSHAHSVGLLDDAGPAASEYDEPFTPGYARAPEFVDVTGMDVSPSAAAQPIEATTATLVTPESTNFVAADVSNVAPAMPAETAVEPEQPAPAPTPSAANDPAPASAEVEQPAPAEESLNPWLSDLPAKRRSSQAIRSANDEAILFSIRPLAQHDEPPPPAWRRMLPYSILVLVLFVVAANLVLIALFRREARRDAQELRQALARQDQATANLIVQELREELREPSPLQLQAMQDLGDGLIAKQTNVAEKLQAELATHREFIKQEAARKEPAASRDADAAQAALLHELAEIKQSIAGLQKPASPQTAATPSQPSAQAEAAERATPVPAAEQTTAPAEPAAPAVAAAAATVTAVTSEAKGASTTFVIDASGALQHSIRAAVDEVRRIVEAGRLSTSSRVLLLYQGRLFELPPSTLDRAADPADPVDRGPADLATTVKLALENRPPALHLLSDTLGDPGATLKVIRAADTSGTSIHVTQFYSRDHRDQLKALARDYHGNYSYIAQR
jgi:hypothetical protein